MSASAELALAIVGFAAGFVGALSGIGGGIIVTPVLALYFGLPLRQSIGTSLVAVITTSTASSSIHVQRHTTDIKLGMTLELATTMGAAVTAYLAAYVNRSAIGLLFSAFLYYSAVSLLRKAWTTRHQAPMRPTGIEAIPDYKPKHYTVGLGGSLIAGGLSGLLGIGGGPIKVPIMYLFMGIPLLVATATSNFMIGVTAAASSFVYYRRGDIRVDVAAALCVGVFAGSLFGARLAPKIRARYVSLLLVAIMLYLATQMIVKVATGKIG
jgi:uncharacterized protein